MFLAQQIDHFIIVLIRQLRSHYFEDLLGQTVALQCLERRHGRLPETLEALVSEGLLPKLPIDPLTEKPYRYDPAQRTLAAGRDLRLHPTAIPYDHRPGTELTVTLP